MEKRIRGLSLAGLLWRYLLAAGLLCLAVCLAALFSFQFLINCGFILPASAGSEAAAQGAAMPPAHGGQLSRRQAAGPVPLGRILFAAGRRGGAAHQHDGWHLEKALNAWRGGSGNWGYTQYHTAVPLADGAVAYFQYDYAVPYANPALRGKLPDFQTMFLATTALRALAAWCGLRTA